MNQFSVRNHLKDTAFCISLLSTGSRPENFENWYKYCQDLVVQFSDNLRKDNYTDSEVEQLSYAQCALLDEIALKNLDYPDRDEWEKRPLQVHFFQNYHAGETVCDRIETLVNENNPNPALIEGYLSILGLGFQGRYVLHHSLYEQQKKRLSNQFAQLLQEKKTRFAEPYPQEHPQGKILWLDKQNKHSVSWNQYLSAPVICLLIVIITLLLYFILNYYLDVQIQMLKK